MSLLGDNCDHVPIPESDKQLVDMLDLKLLSKEEIDDMKVIAKKVKASGKSNRYAVIHHTKQPIYC